MDRIPHRTRLATAVVAAVLLGVLVGCGGESPSPPAPAPEAAEELKEVQIVDFETVPSPSPTELRATLEEGELPEGAVAGTVRTDEDCDPDRRGISRCRNEVLVDGAGIVVLRHAHDMRKVPCLAPGERVLLSRA